MKKRFLPLLLIVLVISCAKKNDHEFVLEPADFEKKLQSTEGALMLDVRTPAEVATGTLAGASNIVYDERFSEKLADLPHRPIFIYCASGKRSAKAAAILREKGYEPVYELKGGLGAWKESQREVR